MALIKILFSCLAGLICYAGLGCSSQYRVSLNNNDLVHQRVLFSDYKLSDPALQTCVTQTIKDQSIQNASGLTQLNCSSAGIRSLTGLNRFEALKYLNLSHNTLSSVAELVMFEQLQMVDLSANPNLICAELTHLKGRIKTLKAPQCESK